MRETARAIALTHHERRDGSCYPSQLKGEDTPQAGRIVAIDDVFGALISVRPYEEAYRIEKAVKIMNAEDGSHSVLSLMTAFRKVCRRFRRSRKTTPMKRAP